MKTIQLEQSTTIDSLRDRIVSLENHMRRDNLKFLNINLPDYDAAENCEDKIIRLCSDLGIQIENNDIVRTHHTGQKRRNTQPIIVRFHQFKVKQRVLKAKPNSGKLE